VGYCSRSKSGLGLCGRGACRRRARIHLAFGELRQHRVSLFLLLKSLMQRFLVVPQIELARQRRGRAVGRNLVMLKLLRRRDQGEKTEGSCRAAAFIAKLRNSFLRWGIALAISPRGKYLHLPSRAAEKLPELPELPDSDPGDSGNSGNFLVGPAPKNRNFLATDRARAPRPGKAELQKDCER
jgi:hypothetical protein